MTGKHFVGLWLMIGLLAAAVWAVPFDGLVNTSAMHLNQTQPTGHHPEKAVDDATRDAFFCAVPLKAGYHSSIHDDFSARFRETAPFSGTLIRNEKPFVNMGFFFTVLVIAFFIWYYRRLGVDGEDGPAWVLQ